MFRLVIYTFFWNDALRTCTEFLAIRTSLESFFALFSRWVYASVCDTQLDTALTGTAFIAFLAGLLAVDYKYTLERCMWIIVCVTKKYYRTQNGYIPHAFLTWLRRLDVFFFDIGFDSYWEGDGEVLNVSFNVETFVSSSFVSMAAVGCCIKKSPPSS